MMASSTFHPTSYRSRQRAARPGPRSEDAQPNESVNRRQRHPPTVNSAAHSRRSWRAGRGPYRPVVTHHNLQSVVRERTGTARRALPPSTSATRVVSYARPHSLATTSGTGWPNTAQSPIYTVPRQGHAEFTSSWPASGSSAPERPKPKPAGSPAVDIKREIPTETTASSFSLSVSPVSSETLVGDHKVKVERSVTPELNSKPQFNRSGSNRYAPLPPECKNTHPNHAAARSAWARKEQEALRSLGLKVVRTFIRFVAIAPPYPFLTCRSRPRREDGMVIDWCVHWIIYSKASVFITPIREAIDNAPTDIAAVIERALLLNDAATRNPPAERATSPPKSASQGSRRHQLDGGNDEKLAMEIAPLIPLKAPGLPSQDHGADASRIRGHPENPSMDRRSQSQTQTTHMDTGDDAEDTPAPIIAYFSEKDLRDTTPTAALPPFSYSSSCTRSPMPRQTTSEAPSHRTTPSSQGWMRASSSQSTRPLLDRSASPRTFTSPPPSQHALDGLRNILRLKRQMRRSSSSTGPSPSPSCPLQKPPAAPKEEQLKSPSKRPAQSSADVVAAAINESTRLSQGGSGRASASSTPLRVYKKHRPDPTLVRANGKSTVARSAPAHRKRESLSPEKKTPPPPIADPGPSWSSLGSPLTALTTSASGDEFDELDLSYPPSPKPPFPSMMSHFPSVEVPTKPPRRLEPAEPIGDPSLPSFKMPSPEETAAMQSAALQYLQRYGRTFDTDRRALAGAYAPDAAFSCPSRGMRTQGREGILDALETLGGVLCSRRNVEYDVSRPVPGIGVMLVVLGTISCAQGDGDKEVGYTMNFVLQLGDHEDRSVPKKKISFDFQQQLIISFYREPGQGTGQWPLVAAMHQIVLREGS